MFTTKYTFRILLACIAMITITLSCKKKKDQEEEASPESKGPYVLAITAFGSSSEATDYVVQTKDLMSGTISTAGNGIEQKSYRMYEKVGGTLLSITYQGTNIVPGYVMNNGILEKKSGEFSILRLHARTVISDQKMLGMYIPRDLITQEATFYEIDATSMSVPKQAKINVFDPASGTEQAYFSCMLLDNGKLYAPFFSIKNSSWDSDFADSAYVAVYSYPDLVLEKVIKDPRTGTIGIYAGNDGLFKTENGDIYSYSPTAIASGNAPSAKPSGILRIKSGISEFDSSYFFNVEEVTGGYKLAQIQYMGNGKALAQIYSFKDHTAADKWTTRDVRMSIIDLASKTVAYVSDIPLHTGGLQYKCIREEGVAYAQVNIPSEGIYIYKIDIASAKGTRGAKVDGKAVMGFFKM